MSIPPPEEEDGDSSSELDSDDYGDEEHGCVKNEAEDCDEDPQEESIHGEAQKEIRDKYQGASIGELFKRLRKYPVELKSYSEKDVVKHKKKVRHREKKEE